MNGLEKLKKRLFKQSPKESDIFFRFCEIISLCGSYQNFLETPIPVIMELNKYLEELAKREAEMMKKLKIPRLKK